MKSSHIPGIIVIALIILAGCIMGQCYKSEKKRNEYPTRVKNFVDEKDTAIWRTISEVKEINGVGFVKVTYGSSEYYLPVIPFEQIKKGTTVTVKLIDYLPCDHCIPVRSHVVMK